MLTKAEKELILKLGACWNDFLQLPVEHNQDIPEFCASIHRLQEKVAARPALRILNGLTGT